MGPFVTFDDALSYLMNNLDKFKQIVLLDAPHEFSATKRDLVRVRTMAPQAYDYSYCREVAVERLNSRVLRTVDVPRSEVDYQVGRYESGSYFTEVIS